MSLLRIGLLVDSLSQPAWAADIISEIHQSDFAKIVAVILNSSPAPAAQGFFARLWEKRRHLFYYAYLKFDKAWFPCSPDAFALVDISSLVCSANASIIKVTPRKKGASDYFPDDAVGEIAAANLDVALRFGFRILRGRSLLIARHGVWSYHHDDNQELRGGPPGFWEVVTRAPTTGSVLQVLREELDNGQILYRSYARTDRASVRRSMNSYYWKSARFVGRALRRPHETGEPALEPAEYHPYARGTY